MNTRHALASHCFWPGPIGRQAARWCLLGYVLTVGTTTDGFGAPGAIGTGLKPVQNLGSRHFIVHDTRSFGRSLTAFAGAERQDPRFVQFDPESLLFSVDRIRESLIHELRLPDRAGPPVQCFLYAAARNDEPIIFSSDLFTDGWRYRITVPDNVEGLKAIRAVVQVALLEHANQGASKSAEIPTWLVEGLTMMLVSDPSQDSVFSKTLWAKSTRLKTRTITGHDPLGRIRAFLRSDQLLSFSELSGSPPSAADEAAFLRYQLSAQLLVAEILHAPDGRTRLATMLQTLPHCWNWQTAFLSAFGFDRLLAVEKWWSVSVASFAGHDASVLASDGRALERLGQLLVATGQVRLDTNTVPARSEVSLSRVIAESSFESHRSVIQERAELLARLRRNAPIALAPLMDEYRDCLESYLRQRERAGVLSSSKRDVVLPAATVVRQTTRRLSELDARLEKLRQAIRQAAFTAAAAPAANP